MADAEEKLKAPGWIVVIKFLLKWMSTFVAVVKLNALEGIIVILLLSKLTITDVALEEIRTDVTDVMLFKLRSSDIKYADGKTKEGITPNWLLPR